MNAAQSPVTFNKNSAGDEIANMNFFCDDIVHVEESAYAH